MGANDPRGHWVTGSDSGQIEPHGQCGRINIVLHTSEYRSCVLHGFTQNLKTVFPNYKSMEANDPQGVANLDPRGMAGTIYVGDH